MTALPELPESFTMRVPSSDHPLTIAEYAALGETESGYTELVGGRLLMSPSPRPDHNIAVKRLLALLDAQAPDHLEVIPHMDIDLELVSADEPGYSRRPDLIVVERAAVERVSKDGSMLKASDTVLVVEIVSPGSKRIDHVDKHGEYADAGIPYYWIVDITEPVSLVACHQAGEFGYQDSGAVTGEFVATTPFPVTMRLNELK